VSSTKRQKMQISRSIVDAVRSLDPPGRFLEKNLDTGLWSDSGHKKAVEKTSQALRDGAASLRKQLSADLGDPDFFIAVFNMDEDEQGPKEKEKSKEAKEGGEDKDSEISEDKDMDINGTENKAKKAEKLKLPKKVRIEIFSFYASLNIYSLISDPVNLSRRNNHLSKKGTEEQSQIRARVRPPQSITEDRSLLSLLHPL
jgi:hypothetical protein